MYAGDNLLKRLQMYDFMLFELNLYLDTHPNCPNAMAMHKKYKALRNSAAEEYERRFGPLTALNAGGGDTWDWVNSPWPWEKEAN